ncbi:uncharacterized protein C14orf93-like [Ptychodera flava]|uniref:uncharacterized protein C14orf93-like n=1 Tax=Ptychodera flava TaxID=63121 RepID=UPI00396A05BF
MFLDHIEQKFDQVCSQYRQAATRPQGNLRTPGELSIALKNLTQQEEFSFKPEERITSRHNAAVRRKLTEIITEKYQDTYSSQEYSLAVKRRFDTDRVKFRESENTDFGVNQKVRRRKRSRLHKILKRRSTMIHGDEKDFWNDVTADLMSDEEVLPDLKIIASRPSWRSDKLNDFIDTLNQRMLNDSHSRDYILRRKYGRASERPPPKKQFSAEFVRQNSDS